MSLEQALSLQLIVIDYSSMRGSVEDLIPGLINKVMHSIKHAIIQSEHPFKVLGKICLERERLGIWFTRALRVS